MAKKAARSARRKAVSRSAKKTVKKSTKKARGKKAKKKALRPRKKRSAAAVISTVPGRFAWSVLISVLSSATGHPTITFQLNDDLAKYGFYDLPSKSRLAQLLRDRHVEIDDGPVVEARTVGDLEKVISGKVPEKDS